jgi:ferredoxin
VPRRPSGARIGGRSPAPGLRKRIVYAVKRSRHQVTYVICQPCIGVKDKSCVDVCPVDCIKGTDEDTMLYIDPSTCIDCGACVAACPVTAIFNETEVPDQWKEYTKINADYFNK